MLGDQQDFYGVVVKANSGKTGYLTVIFGERCCGKKYSHVASRVFVYLTL